MINKSVRLTETAKQKIRTRLRTYGITDILKAQHRFSRNRWRMQHNRSKPLVWWYGSDDQIEKWLMLEDDMDKAPEDKCQKCGTPGFSQKANLRIGNMPTIPQEFRGRAYYICPKCQYRKVKT